MLKLELNPQDIILSEIVGLDLETSGLQAWIDTIQLIIISTNEHLYILEPGKYDPGFIKGVFNALSQCDVVVAHNAKFDCGFIYANYGVLLENWYCTLLGSQMISNGRDGIISHTLPSVIERYLNVKLEFAENKKLLQKSFTSDYSVGSFTERQLRYASDDVKYLIPLYLEEHRHIKGLELEQISKLENSLVPVLAKMEVEGILIDRESWHTIIKSKWEPKLYEIERQLDAILEQLLGSGVKRNKTKVISYDLFGFHTEQVIDSPHAVNYASATQVIDVFKEAGEKPPTILDDETGEEKETVDDLALVRFLNENPVSKLRSFIETLREYREQAKLISTYGQKFLDQLDRDSKIHTQYTQAYTKTGRLSSKSPNLQNIPSPDEQKPDNDVRRFFIARPGYKLITCDMASAEVAIAADYSGEQLLLDSLLNGKDMHSELASVSFSIIFGQDFRVSKSKEPVVIGGKTYIPDNLRTAHKSVVFAKFYKAGAKRIYSTLAEYINAFYQGQEERLAIASKISKAIDERMPSLSKYLSELISRAQNDGYLRTSKLGRIRWFNKDVYGEAANAPIQGTNAEAIKMAMLECYKWFKQHPVMDARIAMNVHDELVCEVLDYCAEPAAAKIKDIVANSLGFFLERAPAGASVEICKHWKK